MKICCGSSDSGPMTTGRLPRNDGTGVGLRPQIDLGEVDQQQADAQRRHHPHVAAGAQEGQHREPLRHHAQQEQRRHHQRQHDQSGNVVLHDQGIGEHAPQHHPHAQSEVQDLGGREGQAVADRNQSVDRAGGDAAGGDLQEEVHEGGSDLIPASGRAAWPGAH